MIVRVTASVVVFYTLYKALVTVVDPPPPPTSRKDDKRKKVPKRIKQSRQSKRTKQAPSKRRLQNVLGCRWSHSCVSIEEEEEGKLEFQTGRIKKNILVGFGGYGYDTQRSQNGTRASGRLNDVFVITAEDDRRLWVPVVNVTSSSKPTRRQHHSCVHGMDGSSVLIFGGRTNPRKGLNDVWVLRLKEEGEEKSSNSKEGEEEYHSVSYNCVWEQKSCSSTPSPRWRHSAVRRNTQMIVFGGRNKDRCLDDLFVLDIKTWKWSIPKCCGDKPSPRHSHSAVLTSDKKSMVVFGGYHGEGDSFNPKDRTLYTLNLKTWCWSKINPAESPKIDDDRSSCIKNVKSMNMMMETKDELVLPPPLSSHTSVVLQRYMLVVGSCYYVPLECHIPRSNKGAAGVVQQLLLLTKINKYNIAPLLP